MTQLTLKCLRFLDGIKDHQDPQSDLFAVLFGALGIGLWAFLLYELATHLLPPSW